MDCCYPLLPCSLGPLWHEPVALVYYLTFRNRMFSNTSLATETEIFHLFPSKTTPGMNSAAHSCNRIWRWTCLLTDQRNAPWNIAAPDFYLTINAAPLAQPQEAACEKWSDWLIHLTQCTCVSGSTESLQGGSLRVAPLLGQKETPVRAGVTPERRLRLRGCYLCPALTSKITGYTIQRASRVSHVGQCLCFDMLRTSSNCLAKGTCLKV